MYDSLKIFGLNYGSSLAEVKTKYRSMSRTYHPDKHQMFREETGMTDQEAMEFFQLFSGAWEYLREKL